EVARDERGREGRVRQRGGPGDRLAVAAPARVRHGGDELHHDDAGRDVAAAVDTGRPATGPRKKRVGPPRPRVSGTSPQRYGCNVGSGSPSTSVRSSTSRPGWSTTSVTVSSAGTTGVTACAARSISGG